MTRVKKFPIQTNNKKQIISLTSLVSEYISSSEIETGICTIFVQHTTAGVSIGEIGEGTEQDFLVVMEKIIPKINFRHLHDPSHAWSHMASSLAGHSVSLPFEKKKLLLGTWQDVFLIEFDGPRERTIILTLNG